MRINLKVKTQVGHLKNVILSKIDEEWKEHLREMDDLRSAVDNATYEQDPLVIYKLESYELFKNMLSN